MDKFDKGWHDMLIGCWTICLFPISGLGWLWLFAWYFKDGYRDLAMSSGFGSLTPYIAWTVALAPLMVWSYIVGQVKQAGRSM